LVEKFLSENEMRHRQVIKYQEDRVRSEGATHTTEKKLKAVS
jgi:hypothetical protein